MAIRRKSKSNQSAVQDLSDTGALDAFIGGGGQGTARPAPAPAPVAEAPEAPEAARERKTQITHRIDRGVLVDVDRAATRAGVTRASWINMAIADKLGRTE